MPRELAGVAPESEQVQRQRAKLLKRWEEEKGLVSPQAIDTVKKKIQAQYHRNISLRTRVEDPEKPLGLFAQGKGVKEMASPKVLAVMERVQAEFQRQKEARNTDFPPMTIKPLDGEGG